MTPRRITVDQHESDQAVVDKLWEELRLLCGGVVEMLETNPRTLLSPWLREMLVRQAKKVQEFQSLLEPKLFVDNPGPPLEVPK
jgi:hypothetical protein